MIPASFWVHPRLTKQGWSSQCQHPLGQHLRPYVTLTLRLSLCPEHLIPDSGSQLQPTLPEVRFCCHLAPWCALPSTLGSPHPFSSLFPLPPPTHIDMSSLHPPLLLSPTPHFLLTPAPVPYESQLLVKKWVPTSSLGTFPFPLPCGGWSII